MAGSRRGNLHTRLKDLEHLAGQARDRHQRRTVIYLPRKDGDDQPVGVYSMSPGVLMVFYEPDQPMPTLPEGW